MQAEHEAEVVRQVGEEEISVDPGFAKRVVRPYSRQTSKVASRTERSQRSTHK